MVSYDSKQTNQIQELSRHFCQLHTSTARLEKHFHEKHFLAEVMQRFSVTISLFGQSPLVLLMTPKMLYCLKNYNKMRLCAEVSGVLMSFPLLK